MNTSINIEAVLLQEHKSVWAFCSRIEEVEEGNRALEMISQGLQGWSYQRGYARKELLSIIQRAEQNIKDIDTNMVSCFHPNTNRLDEYNAKAETQVEMVCTASYIIGINNETLGKLFATVTTLQFNKETSQ